MEVRVICQSQFGYHLDTWYYCKYLSKYSHVVSYICWDYGLKKKSIDGVEVHYVSRSGGSIARYLRYLYVVLFQSIKSPNSVVFIKYFPGCSLLSPFMKKSLLDIRTASVVGSSYMRMLWDNILKLESLVFSNISIISRPLAESLKIKREVSILPLGADVISNRRDFIQGLGILYVGTLSGRNILDTLIAVKEFKNNSSTDIHYHIVGDGWRGELDDLKQYVKSNNLSDSVTFYGYVHHDDLCDIYSKCNIGLSYIPMTEYFDNQPPTKTYEYLLSNLFVIATETSENFRILKSNRSGSLLIKDNSSALVDALLELEESKRYLGCENQSKYESSNWKNIVTELEALLRGIYEKN